ncbi:hypothetical protein [Streptomyces milbemycinicus]
MQQVCQDRRIFFEAHRQPYALSGLRDGTAVRYIAAAHPERTAELPR